MNAASILTLVGPSSHITGHLTQAFLQLAQGHLSIALQALFFLACFCLGALISGYLFANRTFHLDYSYGILLVIIGLFLGLVHGSMASFTIRMGAYLLALGIQNGMFIYYRGLVVRTTHFTGTLTDLGFSLGMLLKGQKEILWKVVFYLKQILAFAIGIILASFIVRRLPFALGPSLVLAYLLLGVYYFFIRTQEV